MRWWGREMVPFFGQLCRVFKVYRVWISCCFLRFQAGSTCFARRSLIKREMGPLGVVECHPVFDDPSGLEAVSDLFGVDGFLLQDSPQPFDEDVVQASATPIHADVHARFGQRLYPRRSAELAALDALLSVKRRFGPG